MEMLTKNKNQLSTTSIFREVNKVTLLTQMDDSLNSGYASPDYGCHLHDFVGDSHISPEN